MIPLEGRSQGGICCSIRNHLISPGMGLMGGLLIIMGLSRGRNSSLLLLSLKYSAGVSSSSSSAVRCLFSHHVFLEVQKSEIQVYPLAIVPSNPVMETRDAVHKETTTGVVYEASRLEPPSLSGRPLTGQRRRSSRP